MSNKEVKQQKTTMRVKTGLRAGRKGGSRSRGRGSR